MSGWKFIGEGGANIVLAYEGEDSPEYKRKVLRIRKVSNGLDSSLVNKIQAIQAKYYQFVIGQLVDVRYALDWEMVNLAADFIDSLQSDLENQRLEHRRSTGRLDRDCNLGYLLPNLLEDNFEFVIELKPKWGVSCSITRKCKFCRLQSSRVHYDTTAYCPCDLFSLDQKLVGESLNKLFASPRNQLRLLKGGRIPIDRLKSILLSDPILEILSKAHHTLFNRFSSKFLEFKDDDSYLVELEACLTSESTGLDTLDPLILFLISITLEDISLMICFNERDYIIKIIDADIKLPRKLKHYIEEHDLLLAGS